MTEQVEADHELTPTREALVGLSAATQRFRNFRLPEIRESAHAVEKLGAGKAVPAKPKDSILDQVRKNLIAAMQSGDLGTAGHRDLREAPWLLWEAKEPLASLPGLLDLVAGVAGRSGSTRRKLIQAWLLGFEARTPRIDDGGRIIRRLLSASDDPRLDRWRRPDRALDLFDARRGPSRIAAEILSSDRPIETTVQEVGLAEPLQAVGGYARAIQAEVLNQFGAATKFGAGEVFARCVGFLAPGARLRFDDGPARGEIARGLLAPWLLESKHPVDALRGDVQSFLLHHLGDPRIRPQHWKFAGDDAVALMRRWLARASLKAFFALIDDHALDAHWRYRGAFWSACLNKGAIEDTWLALGSRVYGSARAVKDLNGSYGRLEGGRVAGDQSVLLLKIGKYVFCEWSHNGKLRVWPSDWKAAPRLERSSYSREDLTTQGLPFPPSPRLGSRGAPDGHGLSHIGSERSYWQGSAAEFLARHAGVQLSPADWMPR